MNWKALVTIVTLTFFAGLLAACGGGGGSGTTVKSGNSYAGPGSSWTFNLYDDGSFAATETDADPDLEISGTWATTDSGFKKLTVSTTSDASSVAVGSTGYGVDIPGVVFLLKPFNGDQLITAVKTGECPQASFTANWIMANKNADAGAGSDLFGTFSYDSTTGSATLPSKYDIDNNTVAPGPHDNLGTFTCADGIANVADAKMYLTQIGAAIVHTNGGTPNDKTDDNFIVAMQSQALGTSSAIDDEYIGLVFETSSGGDNLFPVYVNLSGGTGTGQEITNVDTNDLDPGTVTINYSGAGLGVDNPSNGLVNATVGLEELHCTANTNVNGSGKNFLYCVGDNPGEPDVGNLYNLLLLSK